MSGPAPTTLEADLRLPGGACVRCRLLTLSPERATATPRGDEPGIAVGSAVELVFFAGGPSPLAVRALVGRRNEGRERSYELWFEDPERVAGEVAPLVLPLLDRRRDRRVEPAPGEAVAAELRPADGAHGPALAGEVQDVSAGGVRVRTNALDEGLLAGISHVLVRLELPEHPEPIELTGAILHRHLDGAGIAYGIHFEPGSQELSVWRELAAAYVARRLRQRGAR